MTKKVCRQCGKEFEPKFETVRVCEHCFEKNKEASRLIKESRNSKPTFLYLVAAEGGALKIGITKDLRQRMQSLSGTTPLQLRFIAAYKVANGDRDAALKLEKDLHLKYQTRRASFKFSFPGWTEFFMLSPDEVQKELDQLLQVTKDDHLVEGSFYPELQTMNTSVYTVEDVYLSQPVMTKPVVERPKQTTLGDALNMCAKPYAALMMLCSNPEKAGNDEVLHIADTLCSLPKERLECIKLLIAA
ncbi:GIY-YIG nuclease family protein [Escherichia coli]|uniref:GIY-YIG nuclease family protein n=1 Tax=Escherichia coli TaxID=562 RepID=UPI001CA5F4EE|nr:GIY-YIG nuclease family protein [Escherichia coli]QZY67684.1 GIY-YIG nuclease family protein [Escherichia coli]